MDPTKRCTISAYRCRCLTDCERRYSQTEKEALALVWACEKFHAYVYGMKFDLVTDHKPLEAIYGPRSKPCARIERWVLRMQPYDFHVMHIPGTQNIADHLSRLIDGKAGPPEHKHEAEMYVRFVVLNATPRAMNTRAVEEASATDDELHKVRRAIKTGCFDDCKPDTPIVGELCVIGQLVLCGTFFQPNYDPGTNSGTRRTPGHCWHEAEAQNESLVARHGQSSRATQILSWLSDGGTT